MKRRITYLTDGESPFNPNQAQINNNTLKIRRVKGAKQERLTFGFDALPDEIWQVLKACRDLHIRWCTERPYKAIAPFSSRVSPGLHVFYTPIAPTRQTEHLCPLLKKVFDSGLKCALPEISFTKPLSPPSNRIISDLQFYSTLSSLADLVTYIQQKLCQNNSICQQSALRILLADSVDIDYDDRSHSLTVSVYWSQAETNEGWEEDIRKHDLGSEKVEVGLLALEKASNLEEISLGGFLVVLGEDKSLKPTLFSFPSIHHPLLENAAYNVSFESPTGLHPTLKISTAKSSLGRPPARSDAACALYTYLTLPSTIFADKYQLSTSDSLFLASHNLVALHNVSGETDLEAPDWVIPRWGSNLLLEIATPSQARKGERSKSSDMTSGNWDITIPLHLRYLEPTSSGHRRISMPWPIVFWVCSLHGDDAIGVNPFNRGNLGWDDLFGRRTTFFQLHPSTQQTRLAEDIEVPVLSLPVEQGDDQARQAVIIELGTVVVVVLGFVWVLWKLGGVTRSDYQKSVAKAKQKKDK